MIGTWHKGQLWTAQWDTLEAHSKTLRIPAPVPYKLGVVGVNLYPPKGAKNQESITVPIAGTETHSMTPQEASGMAWEYIRTFMEEGKQEIPEISPLNKTKTSSIKEVWIANNPFPTNPSDLGPFIFGLILLPIGIAFAVVSIPTDFIFMGLDKILPQRKMPKPLRDLSQAGA